MMCAAFLLFFGMYADISTAAPPPLPIKAPVTVKPVLPLTTNPSAPQNAVPPKQPLAPPPVLKMPLVKCPELKVTTPEILPAAWVEREYSYRLASSGGSGELSFLLEGKNSLPPGLRLMTNGTLLGRPVKEGEYMLPILLQDNCPTGMQQVRKKLFLKVQATIRPLATGPDTPVHKVLGQLGPTDKGVIQSDSARKLLKQPDPDNRALTLIKPDPNLKTMDLKARLLSGVTPPAGLVTTPPDPDKAQTPHIQGQIVVTMQMEKGIQIIKLLQDKYKLNLLESFTIKALKQMVATFSTDQDLAVLIQEIRKESGVVLTQKNQIYGTYAEPKSDMQNLCALMDFSKLHKYRRGKRIIVALIDTGVDLSHEDLKKRVIYSENFIKGSPYRAEVHGTAVAGIIAASINGFGIEGIAPEVDILALRACEQVSEKETIGRGYTISIIQALDVAIEKKAKIVNMSFGSPTPDPIITSLIIEGARQGILFVAPVGNRPGQEYPAFPASCPGVIAVGGLDQNGSPFPDDHLASFAKVNAPAENIFTTLPGNKYNFMTGTSFSSAIVAGVLALGIENNPGLSVDNLPERNTDFCAWVERLLNIKAICRQ
jgi:subtilisin family serine protease